MFLFMLEQQKKNNSNNYNKNLRTWLIFIFGKKSPTYLFNEFFLRIFVKN